MNFKFVKAPSNQLILSDTFSLADMASYSHPGFEEWKKGLNNIVVHTVFNNKGYFGIKSSILKSGICKTFRRSEKDKFKWYVSEMMLYNFTPKGKGLVTNLVNRLKILMMEDMSCNEIERTVLGIKKLAEFEKSDRKNMTKLLEFCDVMMGGKKGRTTSYVNCWWRIHEENYDKDFMESIELDKVRKFAKKGDTIELLKLGELLIKYIEVKDERMFNIYMKMIRIEKVGRRYRRTDGIYLFMEIMESYFVKDDNTRLIFDFILDMITRKAMKERFYFGVWLGIMVWKNIGIDNEKIVAFDRTTTTKDMLDYLIEREKIEIDDYIINDFHVNKRFGLEKFGKVGAWVKDEDNTVLGVEQFNKYKEYYVKVKSETANKKPLAKKMKQKPHVKI